MKKLYVIGNWKMHGDLESSSLLINALLTRLSSINQMFHIGVAPSFVYLDKIQEILSENKKKIKLVAQDVCAKKNGAFTGQVSASMLKDVGCEQVIVGHSERRHGCHETPDEVAAKVAQALEHDLQPIVCIGETLQERESGKTQDVLFSQLKPILDLGEAALKKCVIAYEPVWAIGTGKTAMPDEAQEIHAWVRLEVAKHHQDVAQSLPILYGGSVKPSNALELFKCPDIDGGLIGGASLDADSFYEICQSAAKVLESAA